MSSALAAAAATDGNCEPQVVRVQIESEHFQCGICQGYIIDATTICECLHSFCKSCIHFYFESTSRQSRPVYRCPTCDIVLKDVHYGIKPDSLLQRLIYQLTPNLLQLELERRERFSNNDLSPSINGVGGGDFSSPLAAKTAESSSNDLISKQVLLNIRLEYAQYKRHRPVELQREEHEHEEAERRKAAAGFEIELLKMKRAPVRYLQVKADAPLQILDKLIRSKYSLIPDCVIEFTHFGRLIANEETFIEIFTSFNLRKDDMLELNYEIKRSRQLRLETDYDNLKLDYIFGSRHRPFSSPEVPTAVVNGAKKAKLDTNGHNGHGGGGGLDAEAIKKEMATAPAVVVTPFYDLESALTVDTTACSVSSSTDKRRVKRPADGHQVKSPATASSSDENFLTPPGVEKNERFEKPASPSSQVAKSAQISPNTIAAARPVNIDFLKVKFRKTQSVSPPSSSSSLSALAANKVNNSHRASTDSSKSLNNGHHVAKKPPPPPLSPPVPVPVVTAAPPAESTVEASPSAVNEPSTNQPTPETTEAPEPAPTAQVDSIKTPEPEKTAPDTTEKVPEFSEPEVAVTEAPTDAVEAPKPSEAPESSEPTSTKDPEVPPAATSS